MKLFFKDIYATQTWAKEICHMQINLYHKIIVKGDRKGVAHFKNSSTAVAEIPTALMERFISFLFFNDDSNNNDE